MTIVAFSKIENGLMFDNKEWFFTYSMLPMGYQIQGDDVTIIELNNQIVMLCCKDSTIDGLGFSNIQDEIDYIFGL